ncbi:hypothetical protein GC167_05200 [bacterium]|nr:hypothetical protein [bacterium]
MRSRWVLSTASILLCAVLLAPGLFLGGWIKHEQQQYRKSVRRVLTQGVDRAQLHRISVPLQSASELGWAHHKEFRHRGSMFDIVHREYRPDSAIYWCWWDAEENRLMSDLNRLVQGLRANDPDSRRIHEYWMHFLKGFWQQEGGAQAEAVLTRISWARSGIWPILKGHHRWFDPPPQFPAGFFAF